MGKMNIKKAEANRIKNRSWDDILYTWITRIFLVIMVGLMLYPVYFVVVASFSSPVYVNNGTFLIFPKGFTLRGYKEVFRDERIWIGYANTIFYTVCGTILGTSVTLLAGYALSRKDLPGRAVIMKLLVFTMYFSGGMIPFYLIVKGLGLLDTRISMIILGSLSVYNVIVVRSFMASNIPDELYDAAIIDGCGNGRFFMQIVVPLSKAVIAVIVLYIAVSKWNSYFNALLFLSDTDKYPLQVILRQILLAGEAMLNDTETMQDMQAAAELRNMAMVVKYSVIVVATAPIICVYPFIQKYFVKGVMIGSVKG